MSIANSLTLERVNENVQLDEPFDGAMSAALTRGQLPLRQRRHHPHHRHERRHHHRRSHHRHFHHLKVNNNNNNNLHSHNHSPPLHHANNYHAQYRYTSHQQTGREHFRDKLENDEKRTNDLDESEEPAERRPKVNPIFLWALQREQRIVEVRCEDYDKRNRIKLTKTPHGWRSIPRTVSNVYSSCCCTGSNYNPVAKNALASSSPSVSSTYIPRPILSSQNASLSLSPLSESMSFSSGTEPNSVHRRKNTNIQVPKSVCKKKTMKTKPHTRNSTYHESDDDESDETRSSCRNSQQSFDLSYADDQDEDPDDADYVDDDEYDEYEFENGDDCIKEENEKIEETSENSGNSSFLNCEKTSFRFIDLEKARNNQLLQPRVVLEPLDTFTIRINNLRERPKLDDEIEMIVEEVNDEDYVKQRNTEEQRDETNEELNGVEFRTNDLSEQNELSQHHCTKTENSEDEIEEIEEIDDKDEIEELDDENTTVFEYDDRDSADMMDDDEFEGHDEILLKPTELYPRVVDNTENVMDQAKAISSLEDDMIEEEEIEDAVDVRIHCKQTGLSGNISQVPDLEPINNSSLKNTTNKFSTGNQHVNETSTDRLLPSPPCSVTCSEDASRIDISHNSAITLNRQRREAPDLIEVNPTEWRRRSELLRPAHQLRELIEKSSHSIPDPLLVPRDCLPALATNPGIEIPRLLVTRPELRLPEALMRPELLGDPDILVISLSHLQQVLDAVPEPIKFSIEERVNDYALPNNIAMSTNMNSNRKRLSVKPIGSLMPAPIDLSQHSTSEPTMDNSIFHKQIKSSRQESEVTSTARLPGDDSRLWHPLFGCREKTLRQDDAPRPNSISHPAQDRLHKQRSPNYQQSHQDTGHQHRAPWHRTTLAS